MGSALSSIAPYCQGALTSQRTPSQSGEGRGRREKGVMGRRERREGEGEGRE